MSSAINNWRKLQDGGGGLPLPFALALALALALFGAIGWGEDRLGSLSSVSKGIYLFIYIG